MALFGDRVQASMDPPGKVFQDQAESYKHFPDSVHRIPFVVYGEENVLSLPTLTELHAKSQAVRQEFANNLIDFTDPGSGMNLGAGFFTVADALEQTLQINGSSLLQANNAEFKRPFKKHLKDRMENSLHLAYPFMLTKKVMSRKHPRFISLCRLRTQMASPFFAHQAETQAQS